MKKILGLFKKVRLDVSFFCEFFASVVSFSGSSAFLMEILDFFIFLFFSDFRFFVDFYGFFSDFVDFFYFGGLYEFLWVCRIF